MSFQCSSSSSTSPSSGNNSKLEMDVYEALNTPLLGGGDDAGDEGECWSNDDDGGERSDDTCGVAVLCGSDDIDTDDEDNADADDDESSRRPTFTCCDNIIIWIVLPVLMILQFGTVFLMDDPDTGVRYLNWTVVNWSIVVFVVTAWLYRLACADMGYVHPLVTLFPEMVMDVILGLILWNKVIAAFLLMHVTMLSLALFVLISTIRVLVIKRRRKNNERRMITAVNKVLEDQGTQRV